MARMVGSGSPTIFSPGTLGSLSLRNRVIKAATYEGMSHRGVPTPLLVDHHATLARGGVGMTTVAYCAVSPDGRTFEDQMFMHDALLPYLRVLTGEVKSQGAAVSLQLGHCGHFTRNTSLKNGSPKGPSATLNARGIGAGVPWARAMSPADIEQAVNDFANAARLTKDAGFDAVELQLGHGYLLSQFLSPATNRRRDEFGGSLENRLRFPLMVVDRVRTAVGPYFPVLAKVNVSDGVRNGLKADDAAAIARALEEAEVSALVLSGGLVDRNAFYLLRGERPLQRMIEVEQNGARKLALRLFGPRRIKPFEFEPLFFLEQATTVRNAVQMPLVLSGGITSLAHMNRALDEGFDFVAMGRALIHDPYLVGKYMAGEIDRSGCVPCNLCITEMDQPGGIRCSRQPLQLQRRTKAVAEGLHRQLC